MRCLSAKLQFSAHKTLGAKLLFCGLFLTRGFPFIPGALDGPSRSRHFLGTRLLFECRNRRNGMPVFNAGNVTTKQTCPVLNVALGEFFSSFDSNSSFKRFPI